MVIEYPELTVRQCRMARVGLGLGVRDLAELADVSPNTIARFERGEKLRDRTIKVIYEALVESGAEIFTTEDGKDAVAICQPI